MTQPIELRLADALFSDCKTDEEKSNFFLSGRGYETGVIALGIQNDVAIAYQRCVNYEKELRRLHEVNAALVEALRQIKVQSCGSDWTHEQALNFCKTTAKAALIKAREIE